MLRSPKLIEGHYECCCFDDTLPVLTDLLGREVIQRRSDTEWVVKHPNTGLVNGPARSRPPMLKINR